MVRLTNLKEHIETELEVQCEDRTIAISEEVLENFEFRPKGISKELIEKTAIKFYHDQNCRLLTTVEIQGRLKGMTTNVYFFGQKQEIRRLAITYDSIICFITMI